MDVSVEEKEFELKDYWFVLLKRKWIIITFFFVLLLGTIIFSFLRPPIYKATCSVLIERESPQVLDFQELYPLERMRSEYFETQYQIIKSRSIAEKVVKRIGFDKKADNLDKAIEGFQKSTIVEPVEESMLANISVIGKNPELITKAVNTLAEAYIKNNLEIKLKAYNDTAYWFSKQLPELKEKLEKSEVVLQQYKEREGIVSFEERQSIIMDELEKINTEYIKVKTERIKMETTLNELRKLSGDAKNLETIPEILEDDLIKSLKEKYITLETELNRISKLYKPKHPERISKEYQLSQLRERINEEIKKIVSSIRSEHDILLAKERNLKAALDEQNRKALDLNKKAIQNNILQREADINKQIYDSVLNRSKETELTKVLETNNIKLVDKAIVPKNPIIPNMKKNMLIAIIFGMLGGLGIAFFLEYMDKSIKIPQDVERFLEIPLLGVIPAFDSLSPPIKRFSIDFLKKKEGRKKKRAPSKNQLITIEEPNSLASEAYRTLRTNLLFSANEKDLHSLLITSVISNEGKSTVVANLGIILTYLKQKVLIIDADLRNPTLHRVFGASNSSGLLSFLQNHSSYKDIIQSTQIENLDIITSGGKATNPSELLDSNLMRQLIKDVSKKYNFILIDTVTATSLPDAVILSSMVDGVLLVHMPGSSDRILLKYVKKRFLNAGIEIYGVILNNLKTKHKSSYYYPYLYSYYDYYIKEREGQKESDKKRPS